MISIPPAERRVVVVQKKPFESRRLDVPVAKRDVAMAQVPRGGPGHGPRNGRSRAPPSASMSQGTRTSASLMGQ